MIKRIGIACLTFIVLSLALWLIGTTLGSLTTGVKVALNNPQIPFLAGKQEAIKFAGKYSLLILHTSMLIAALFSLLFLFRKKKIPLAGIK